VNTNGSHDKALAARARGLRGGICSRAGASAPDSTVSPDDRYNWSANVGWLDWRANGANGAVFTPTVASGYVYAANIGWIGLGDGSPANGQVYSNTAASDYGINVDAYSDPANYLLSGYAYSANCGWISFDVASPADRPRIERHTGILRGWAWEPTSAGLR
jgi:hypothetical protein